MPAKPFRLPRNGIVALAAAALLGGCGTFDSASSSVVGVFTPYKVEVVQGNFISREQVEALQPGMSRQQVREVLGTPLVSSVFHGDRWDYVFTLKRQGVPPQQRRLTVYFNGETLARHEGDTMPSESEFVAALDKKKRGKIPQLQATEEQLRAASSRTPQPAAAPAAVSAPAAPAGPVTYPPLEPVAR